VSTDTRRGCRSVDHGSVGTDTVGARSDRSRGVVRQIIGSVGIAVTLGTGPDSWITGTGLLRAPDELRTFCLAVADDVAAGYLVDGSDNSCLTADMRLLHVKDYIRAAAQVRSGIRAEPIRYGNLGCLTMTVSAGSG